jgi:hypothetical protein
MALAIAWDLAVSARSLPGPVLTWPCPYLALAWLLHGLGPSLSPGSKCPGLTCLTLVCPTLVWPRPWLYPTLAQTLSDPGLTLALLWPYPGPYPVCPRYSNLTYDILIDLYKHPRIALCTSKLPLVFLGRVPFGALSFGGLWQQYFHDFSSSTWRRDAGWRRPSQSHFAAGTNVNKLFWRHRC